MSLTLEDSGDQMSPVVVGILARLNRIEARLEGHDQLHKSHERNFEKMFEEFHKINLRMDAMNRRIDTRLEFISLVVKKKTEKVGVLVNITDGHTAQIETVEF